MTRKKSENGTATKGRKPKQQFIPGTEPPSIPAIDAAAEEYVEARDARMRALKVEIERHDELLSLMREHKLESYSFDSSDVLLDHKDKVKVKRKRDEEDGDAD